MMGYTQCCAYNNKSIQYDGEYLKDLNFKNAIFLPLTD